MTQPFLSLERSIGDQTFAQWLKLAMAAKSISQNALARQLEISQGTVSAWLLKGSLPNSRTMGRVFELLGCSGSRRRSDRRRLPWPTLVPLISELDPGHSASACDPLEGRPAFTELNPNALPPADDRFVESKTGFAVALEELLRVRRWSRADLARATGVAWTTIARWIEGSVPHRRNVEWLALKLGVSIADLGGLPVCRASMPSSPAAVGTAKRWSPPIGGLMNDARALGVSYQHLRAVLRGERKSASLRERYRQLKLEQAAAL